MKLIPRRTISQALLSVSAALALSSSAFAAQAEKPAHVLALKVEPAALVLANQRDQRRLVVSGRLPDGSWADLTRSARFTPPAGLVRLDHRGFFAPLKAGKGQISVVAAG